MSTPSSLGIPELIQILDLRIDGFVRAAPAGPAGEVEREAMQVFLQMRNILNFTLSEVERLQLCLEASFEVHVLQTKKFHEHKEQCKQFAENIINK